MGAGPAPAALQLAPPSQPYQASPAKLPYDTVTETVG